MRRFPAVLVVVPVVVLALLAGGCGGSSSTILTDAAAPAAGAVSPGTPGAERVLAQAADAELSSLRMTLLAEFGGLEELDGETVSFGVEAAFSADGDRGEFRMDFGEVMALAAAEQGGFGMDVADMFGDAIEMRFLDDTVYMSSGFWAWLIPVDTPWVAFTDDGSGGVDSGFDAESFSAEEFLAILEVLDDDAEVVGSETIDGVDTVHIRGRVSASGIAALDPDFFADLDPVGSGAFELDAFDVDVWVGPDDIVRRLAFGADEGDQFVRFTLDLSDVGGEIDVVAPPADEVTWMDDLMGDAFQFGT